MNERTDEIKKDFVKELQELMKKFDIDEISAVDSCIGYNIRVVFDDYNCTDLEFKWIKQYDIRKA